MRCLVISPVPSWPINQGNAANITRVNQLLQAAGFDIHFVYSALEGVTPGAIAAMARQWEQVDIIPHCGVHEPSGSHGVPLDSWFDPAVADHVARLCARSRYDLVFVHYVWMSAVCDVVPDDCPVWLYTHDRFGDRYLMLAKAGIAPEWYSVAVAEEARGLARADLLLATQEAEADYFRTHVRRPVHVLGSLQTLLQRPARRGRRKAALIAGYAGSANPGNRHSLQQLLRAIDGSPLGDPKRFCLFLAGPIAAHEEFARPYVHSLGAVDRLDELYRQVDIMLNPSVGGSGLKIKTVEFLAAGMPLVSTTDGMMGLESAHPALACADGAAVAAMLPALFNPENRDQLALACREAISNYMAAQTAALTRLLRTLPTFAKLP